jgi:hypothetical protein
VVGRGRSCNRVEWPHGGHFHCSCHVGWVRRSCTGHTATAPRVNIQVPSTECAVDVLAQYQSDCTITCNALVSAQQASRSPVKQHTGWLRRLHAAVHSENSAAGLWGVEQVPTTTHQASGGFMTAKRAYMSVKLVKALHSAGSVPVMALPSRNLRVKCVGGQ